VEMGDTAILADSMVQLFKPTVGNRGEDYGGERRTKTVPSREGAIAGLVSKIELLNLAHYL